MVINIIIYHSFTRLNKVIKIEEKTTNRWHSTYTDEQKPKQIVRVVEDCIVLCTTAYVSCVHFDFD